MELMIQARLNGRLLNHFRIATGGSEILEAKFKLTDIISNAELEGGDCTVPVLGAGHKPASEHEDLRLAGCVRPDQEQSDQAGECERGDHQTGAGHQDPGPDDRGEAEVSSHQNVRSCGPGRQDGARAAGPASAPGHGEWEAFLLRVSIFKYSRRPC